MTRAPILVNNEAMRERVVALIRGLDLAKPWDVTVAPHRKRRSLSQNALYWKWITEAVDLAARETGNEPDDLHDFLKRKFLKPKVFSVGWETTERYTTTDLTQAEMSEYMERIYAWITGELGILLPLPEDALNYRSAAPVRAAPGGRAAQPAQQQ